MKQGPEKKKKSLARKESIKNEIGDDWVLFALVITLSAPAFSRVSLRNL